MIAVLGSHHSGRYAILGLMGLLLLGISMGAECDSDAQASFRQAAADSVGSGVKTILGGLVDGAVAAIKDAGDGSSTDSSSSGNGT